MATYMISCFEYKTFVRDILFNVYCNITLPLLLNQNTHLCSIHVRSEKWYLVNHLFSQDCWINTNIPIFRLSAFLTTNMKKTLKVTSVKWKSYFCKKKIKPYFCERRLIFDLSDLSTYHSSNDLNIDWLSLFYLLVMIRLYTLPDRRCTIWVHCTTNIQYLMFFSSSVPGLLWWREPERWRASWKPPR